MVVACLGLSLCIESQVIAFWGYNIANYEVACRSFGSCVGVSVLYPQELDRFSYHY